MDRILESEFGEYFGVFLRELVPHHRDVSDHFLRSPLLAHAAFSQEISLVQPELNHRSLVYLVEYRKSD